jgi:hypothetical protein
VTIETTFAPDPIWLALAFGAVGSLIASRLGQSRLGPVLSRQLVLAGVLLLVGLVAYSLLMTWLAPLRGATK